MKLLLSFLAFIFVNLTYSNEVILGFKLNYFSFDKSDETELLGEFEAKEFYSRLSSFKFKLGKIGHLKSRFYDHKKYIDLTSDFFELSFLKNDIPFYDRIKYLNFIGLGYYQGKDESHVHFNRAHVDLFDVEIFFRNISGACRRYGSGQFEIIKSCLNDSLFTEYDSSDELPFVEVKGEDFYTDLELNSIRFQEKSVEVDLNNLNVKVGGTEIFAERLTLDCLKESFDSDVNGIQVVKGCLIKGNIEIPLLTISNKEKEIYGDVKVQNFASNSQYMRFKTGNLDFEYEDAKLKASSITANCKTPNLGKNFTYVDIPYSCLDESGFSLSQFHFLNSNVNIEMGEMNFALTDKKLMLVSPDISIKLKEEEFNIRVHSPKITCDKPDMKNITVDAVLRGCFNSSLIDVPRITMEHPSIDSNIEISSISVDKNMLKLMSPKGKYELNDHENKYEALNFRCDLGVSYDLASNLDWKSILKNCIHSSRIKLDSLDSNYIGDGFFKKIKDKISGLLLKSVRDVTFNSKDSSRDQFELVIYPKLLGFLPTGGKLKGRINYHEDENAIIINVDKFYFYKIIPGKDAVMFILNAFVEDDDIEVDEDVIKIKLSSEK